MSNSNRLRPQARIELGDAPETNADRLIEATRDNLLNAAVNDDDYGAAVWRFAVAYELHSRIHDTDWEPPAHADPREDIVGDGYIADADGHLQDFVATLSTSAREASDNEVQDGILENVAELDSRIRGDA